VKPRITLFIKTPILILYASIAMIIKPPQNLLQGLRSNPDFGVGISAVILCIPAFNASLDSPVLIWPTRFGFTFRKKIPFQKKD